MPVTSRFIKGLVLAGTFATVVIAGLIVLADSQHDTAKAAAGYAMAIDATAGGGVDAARTVNGPQSSFSVGIQITAAAQAYAGYQWEIQFPTAGLGFINGSTLEAGTGFSLCAPPVDNTFNANPSAGNTVIGGGAGCVTLSSPPPPPFVGTTTTFSMQCLADGIYPILLLNSLQDPSGYGSDILNAFGTGVQATTVGATITCDSATATPCPGPCPTDTPTPTNTVTPTITLTPTASPTRTPVPEGKLYTASYFDAPGGFLASGTPELSDKTNATFHTFSSSSYFGVYTSGDINFRSSSVQFSAPTGQQLHTGTYENAQEFPSPGVPGLRMDVSANRCAAAPSRFVVEQIEFDGNGVVDRFAASFEQVCSSARTSPLFGEVRYNSTIPFTAARMSAARVAFPDTNTDASSDAPAVTIASAGVTPLQLA